MRGIVLAGGTGSRLGVLTRVVNKHLLPVGGQPMIYWSIKVLRDNNIDDITVVSTARGIGQLAELLGGRFTYRVQDKPGGIAQAVLCADDGSNESVTVILGDNVFLPCPPAGSDTDYAQCYLHTSPTHDLTQFGVAIISGDRVTSIIEKPTVDPGSNYVVTGMYVFSGEVFRRIRKMHLGKRGEYEITDLLNDYARDGLLVHTIVDGFWGDAGTIDSMAECTAAIMAARARKEV